MFKNFILLILIFLSLACYQIPANADDTGKVFHGYAEINEEFKEDSEILTTQKSVVEKGTKFSMVVSNIINTEKNIEGDEFFAEISDDIDVGEGVVIPSGSLVHGVITEIVDPKRFNRDANITLDFDYIATPDGREIPIKANMTTKRSPMKNAAHITAQHAGYTLAGGAMGSLAALGTFGLAGAIASNGYTIAGGAAIGAAIGLGIVMSKKGDQVLLAPGDEINVQFTEKISLPVFQKSALAEEDMKNENLIVNITDIRFEKDPFGEPNTLTLTLDIINKMDKSFSTFNIALMNSNKAIYYPSPFGNTELWFKKIPPYAKTTGKISFSIENPKQKLWLVFFDNYTKEPVIKLSLNNSRRELEEKENQQKRKPKHASKN